MSWQMVLGFEVHVELATASKMFCGCPADHFGKPPNSQTCPVCLGLPGALPVPNAKAIEWCIKLGLALNCQVNRTSKFDRKNYFYPDLPKGYQISQYDQPFCHSGQIKLSSEKTIRITRVHLEEDTGKLQHSADATLVDFNRSGVPLVEIVTEPDFATTSESAEFLKQIQAIVRALGVSSADMEKGSMRLEANVSVRPTGSLDLPNYKVEIKNVNSFRFVKKAIEYEVSRQTQILVKGEVPLQETRGFKESTGQTISQRSKEQVHDYRYFPEPDIPPFEFDSRVIAKWHGELPELPQKMRDRLVRDYQLDPAVSQLLVDSPARYARFMELAQKHDPGVVARLIVNTPEDKLDSLSLSPASTLSDEGSIRKVASKIIAANPKAVADYKSGKQQALFYLIGQIKRELGEVDISLTQKVISEII